MSELLSRIDGPLAVEVGDAGVDCLALAAHDDAGPVFAGVYRGAGRQQRCAGPPLFAIASQSKAVAVAALMKQAERLSVSLDTPFHHFLPELAVSRTSPLYRISLLHLMRHQSPLAAAELALLRQADGSHKPVLPALRRETLLRLFAESPLRRPAGRRAAFQYSDFAIALVGLIAERLAGTRYDRLVERTILKPAGIVDLHPAHAALPAGARDRVLCGHDRRNAVRRLRLKPRDIGALNPAQGGIASAAALSRFYHRLLTGGILSGRHTRLLYESAIPFGDAMLGHRYAPGIIHLPVGGGRAPAYCFGHLGIAGGFCGFTAHFPPLGVTVSLQMNTLTDSRGLKVANPAGFVRNLLRLGAVGPEKNLPLPSLWRSE